MGLFGKLFGGGPVTLNSVRKASSESRFADVCRLAVELDATALTAAEQGELDQLCTRAGDELARLNLDEALGLMSCGKQIQADDYFQLALEKVCSAELKAEIEQAQAGALIPEVEHQTKPDGADCAGCFTGQQEDNNTATAADDDLQMELILTSYPADLSARYLAKGELFQRGFLLAQSGEDIAALKVWAQIEDDQRDEIDCFELGALLARVGELDQSREMLERAFSQNQKLLLAVEALVPVMIAQKDFVSVEKMLHQLLEQGVDAGFCHAQLATTYARQEKNEQALAEVRQALIAGVSDQSFQLFAATVLEQQGAVDEAETILKKIPASGCQSGINLPYAEFLLRHKRELGKILDTFNTACRQDPQEPRWQLRVAQTYLARQWKKDGIKLLKKIIDDPRLGPELAQEAKSLLQENPG